MILPPALGLVLNRPTAYCILLFAIKQWGYEQNVNSKEKLIYFPIAYPTTGLSLAVAVTAWETVGSADSLTAVSFRYRGNKEVLPNLRWISVGV